MVNLGQLRLEHVFPTATHPGMILIARNHPAERGVDCTYATVERSQTFNGHGVLEIGPESIKPLSVFRAAQEEDFLKIASWGSARDAALIGHLKTFPTLEKFLEQRDVRPHQGFIRGNKSCPVPKEIVDWPCLETDGWTRYGMTAGGLSPWVTSLWNVPAKRRSIAVHCFVYAFLVGNWIDLCDLSRQTRILTTVLRHSLLWLSNSRVGRLL